MTARWRNACCAGSATAAARTDGGQSLQFPLGEVSAALGLTASSSVESTLVTGWSIDSRTVSRGDLFFAIAGERQNGHAFVSSALDRGAAAAVISEAVAAPRELLLEVPSTERALQELGGWARRRWAKPVVAVTGSAGKTTTKDIIAALLSVRLAVGKTAGNFNNHLGLPLSLLRLPDAAEVGVIELGMNHAGEIRALASLAEPQIGVVTNVGYAHIENFSSIEGIALAKRELIDALPADGTAVLNADDARVAAFRGTYRGRTISYGVSNDADFRAEGVELRSGATTFRVGKTQFQTSLAGRHGVSNILAGIAVAGLFGLAPAELVAAVEGLEPGKMRGERRSRGGLVILDDSYNSNPDAALTMIDVLRNEPERARRIAVLGEMLELGAWSETLHRRVGEYAGRSGIEAVIGISGAARFLVESARAAGLPGQSAVFFDTPEEAGAFLQRFVSPGDAILFKGSRGTHVERALAIMES